LCLLLLRVWHCLQQQGEMQASLDLLCINAECALCCVMLFPVPSTPPTNLSKQDFVFCKEVRLGSYSADAHHLPLAAIVAAKAMAADPRAEARHGQRVPYVVSVIE
jgi:hypothetical protein